MRKYARSRSHAGRQIRDANERVVNATAGVYRMDFWAGSDHYCLRPSAPAGIHKKELWKRETHSRLTTRLSGRQNVTTVGFDTETRVVVE